MVGILEIVLFLGFLYWAWPDCFVLLAKRVHKMVDIVSNRVVDAFSRFSPMSERPRNDSLATAACLKRFSISQSQRYQRALTREAENKAREGYLFDIKENVPVVAQPEPRPLPGLACYACSSNSRQLLINKTTKDLSLINILEERLATSDDTFFGRIFSHVSHVYKIRKYDTTQLAPMVLKDDRVKNAVEKVAIQQYQDSDSNEDEFYQGLLKTNEKRARKLLNDMKSTISYGLLRFTAWVLYKLFPCFLSAVVVHSGQIQMLKEASKKGIPIIFLPLHRSHLDYIMVSFIALVNNIRVPLVAAGDNLRMPVVGSLLRGLGGFYIKRRIDPIQGRKDYVYKAVLHSYMNAGLRRGNNIEFFLEGGRTRSGKPLMPKYGIFSVVLDAFMDGTIEDALLVPVSMNYEKLVDGNFVREQLGQPKEMETFGATVKSIYQILNCSFGMVRVDFGQPFSLRELVKTFNANGKIQTSNGGPTKKLRSNPSTTSLYGTDVVSDEHKSLVEKISKHVIYDCGSLTSVMSTNAVAFLLMYKFREHGTDAETLAEALDELRSEMTKSGRDVGFSGDSIDVVYYVANLLGPDLIFQQTENDGKTIFKSAPTLNGSIELSYYSNMLVAVYALRSVVAVGLQALDRRRGLINQGDLLEACLEICDMLQYEFLFCKPCQDLEESLIECISNLISDKEIFLLPNVDRHSHRRYAHELDDDSEEEGAVVEVRYETNLQAAEHLAFLRNLLLPYLEAYSATASTLDRIIGRSLLENDLVKETLDEMQAQLDRGDLKYSESLSSDAIKNAFKTYQKWDILECHTENRLRLYYLRESQDNSKAVRSLCLRIDKYRYGFENHKQ